MGFYFRFFLDAETHSARQVFIVLFARIAKPSNRDFHFLVTFLHDFQQLANVVRVGAYPEG